MATSSRMRSQAARLASGVLALTTRIQAARMRRSRSAGSFGCGINGRRPSNGLDFVSLDRERLFDVDLPVRPEHLPDCALSDPEPSGSLTLAVHLDVFSEWDVFHTVNLLPFDGNVNSLPDKNTVITLLTTVHSRSSVRHGRITRSDGATDG